ncbi:hypothetical protein [Colwellia psychrerythraea]|uniref:Uncharacterized protein n=1 Tax=Colwellia psychrerythraea TaxID=28229 RepID=A0A099L229_COLPS|nr:hypothetical protein [Colwellia psychrerythraea]KGJ97014.1 hypothetical protein GAB14E_1482 [Colwellia psychrerythraea]
MPNNTKQLLEIINEVSRQLLSQILTVQKNNQENTTITNEPYNDESNTGSSKIDNKLTELMSKRDKLIRSLFKQKTTNEITVELTLLNEMVALDKELSNESQACKQILAEHVLRLKKSKKVAKTYQQY